MARSDHRHLVLQIALKCADISNPCRPWDISRKWSFKVCEEFFRQGDYERKLNLPVTALCDRHTTSIPKIQTGFFKFVVTPLVTEWHRFLRSDLSAQMLGNLLYNQSKWEMLVAQEIAEETRTEMSDADMIDEDFETCSGTNISDSAELLLPLRRGSLNPTRQAAIRDQLRRFSMPLNVFQDTKTKKDKSRAPSNVDSQNADGSGQSLQSQSGASGHCEHGRAEKVLATETLVPESSIASITTPVQATRLNTVLRGGNWKLIRQQTFPPLTTAPRAQTLAAHPLHTSDENAIHSSRHKTETSQIFMDLREGRFCSLFKNDKTNKDDASQSNNAEGTECTQMDNVNTDWAAEQVAHGSQLRENITTVPLGAIALAPDTRRRKSMPADASTSTSKEKKVREVPGIPELLRRTLSGRESLSRRRGSAPAPVAVSELRGMVAVDSARHSANPPNDACRRPSAAASCQQWLARAPYNVQEHTLPQLPRRSSLPVEVLHRTEDTSPPETKTTTGHDTASE